MNRFIRTSLFLVVMLLSASAGFAYTISGNTYGGNDPLPGGQIALYDSASSTQVGTTVQTTSLG